MTESEKTNQRLAANVLNEQIAAAISAGKKALEIKPGIYRVGEYSVKNIEVVDAKDFVLRGNGATIIQETRPGGMLLVKDSVNTVVEGFDLDCDPLPFTQGRVVAIDSPNQKIDVKIDVGYAVPTEKWVRSNAIFYNASGTSQLFGRWNEIIVDIESLNTRTVRLELISDTIFSNNINLQIGDRVVVPKRGKGSALGVFNCENCTFRDVNIYSADGFGVEEHHGGGGNTYEHIKITRKPDTDRLNSVSADGFHSIQVAKGPIISNCEIAYSQDDLINIHGFMNMVYGDVTDNTVALIVFDRLNFDIGTPINFYELDSMRHIGTTTITDYESLKCEEYEEKIEQLRDDFRENLKLYMRSLSGGRMYRVTLDRKLPISHGAIAETSLYGAEGTIIKDTYLHDGCVRGILLRSNNGRIENNIFERISGAAIYINAERNWLEGPFPSGTVISGNKIEQCASSAMALDYIPGSIVVAMSSLGGRRQAFDEKLYRNITITSNTISNSGCCAIFAINLADSEICGNTISKPWASCYGKYAKAGRQQCIANPFYAIYVDVAENISVVDNEIEGLPNWVTDIKTVIHERKGCDNG